LSYFLFHVYMIYVQLDEFSKHDLSSKWLASQEAIYQEQKHELEGELRSKQQEKVTTTMGQKPLRTFIQFFLS